MVAEAIAAPVMSTPAQPSSAEASRWGKVLIDATRPYASEHASQTYGQTLVTLAVLACTLALAVKLTFWPARLLVSIIAGLVVVRGFILYHDVLHSAMFRGSSLGAKLGRALFNVYGILVLTPPKVWRQTHNYHHAHTAKLVGSHIGSYMMLTPEMYAKATPVQRFAYRAMRHPLNMLLGYLTVFLWGMCLGPFLRSKGKTWDAGFAFVFHFALVGAVTHFAGFGVALHAVIIPLVVACSAGAYLFYAQHNFPGIKVHSRDKWEYTHAALESSSMMVMGPVMNWFTGNIGYHHVHHLNPGIPFYRLPEAMAGVPELQNPPRTSLAPRDVLACLRLKLWDPSQSRMVGYPE